MHHKNIIPFKTGINLFNLVSFLSAKQAFVDRNLLCRYQTSKLIYRFHKAAYDLQATVIIFQRIIL